MGTAVTGGRLGGGQAPELSEVLDQRVGPHGREKLGEIAGIDAAGALTWFDRMYVGPLSRACRLEDVSILDCAAGIGWLSIALALRGARRVVAVDLDEGQLGRMRSMIDILGLGDAIEIRQGNVIDLPFEDRAFEAVCSLETIEHVPIDEAMRELVRVCGSVFMVETINRHFPIDTHDTPLPLVHLLPTPWRRRFNARYGKPVSVYPSLRQVERPLAGFRLLTPFKTFEDVREWRSLFPVAHPYQGGRMVDPATSRHWALKHVYYRTVFGLLGARSRYVLDKIQGVYRRVDE